MGRRFGVVLLAALVAGVQLLPALIVAPPRDPNPVRTSPSDD